MTSIAIVAIICWTIVSLKRDKKTKLKTQSVEKFEVEALNNTISELKSRVATLEQIVTDEKYDLHRQFESLKRENNRAA